MVLLNVESVLSDSSNTAREKLINNLSSHEGLEVSLFVDFEGFSLGVQVDAERR